MSVAAVELENVSLAYPRGQTALDNVDLKIMRGEFVFVAGASGAGKTTLLKMLFGSMLPTAGSLKVAGVDVVSGGASGLARLRRQLGMVFQDFKLLERRTVLENVAYGLEVLGVTKKYRTKVSLSMLEAMGLRDRANSFPLTLSGGEQQRVALARALVHGPRILLADEPTGNLDPEMSAVVMGLLQEANELGITVVVATHDIHLIDRLGKRTVVLEDGGVLGDFPPSVKGRL